MTKKQFLHKCAGMEVADVISLASKALSEKQAFAVVRELNKAMDGAYSMAGFIVHGYKVVFGGSTIEAYGDKDSNYGAYYPIGIEW